MKFLITLRKIFWWQQNICQVEKGRLAVECPPEITKHLMDIEVVVSFIVIVIVIECPANTTKHLIDIDLITIDVSVPPKPLLKTAVNPR